MIKNIYKFFKHVVFAFGLIYSFNIIMTNLNINIPVNIYTILFVSMLGFPGIFTLVGLILLM